MLLRFPVSDPPHKTVLGVDLTIPSVDLRRPLTHFVQGALRDEHGHDLLVDVSEQDHVHEDGVQLVLQSLDRIGGIKTEAEV